MRAAEQNGSRCRSRQSTGEVTTYNRNVWFPRFCPQGCPLPLEWASPRRCEQVAAHARALGQSRALGSPGWHLCVTAAVRPSQPSLPSPVQARRPRHTRGAFLPGPWSPPISHGTQIPHSPATLGLRGTKPPFLPPHRPHTRTTPHSQPDPHSLAARMPVTPESPARPAPLCSARSSELCPPDCTPSWIVPGPRGRTRSG